MCVCVCAYLTEVESDGHVLHRDVRKEALTFDLLVQGEGNPEVSSVPGE